MRILEFYIVHAIVTAVALSLLNLPITWQCTDTKFLFAYRKNISHVSITKLMSNTR